MTGEARRQGSRLPNAQPTCPPEASRACRAAARQPVFAGSARRGTLQSISGVEGMTAMADIFISHVHEEAEVALALKAYFEEQMGQPLGRKPEIFVSSDRWQMRSGNWLERIRKELDSAQVVVLVLSKRSVKRPWVNFEAGAAW